MIGFMGCVSVQPGSYLGGRPQAVECMQLNKHNDAIYYEQLFFVALNSSYYSLILF